MTKAKIILSGVALFTVIGGALAFKASRLPANSITSYTTRTQPGGPIVTLCSTNGVFRLSNAGTPINTYTTILANAACGPVVATFSVEAD